MKCPKCGYLGFERVERCRNCGYDFSLTAPASSTSPELSIRSQPADERVPDDLPLGASGQPAAERPAARQTPSDLPLFEGAVDDAPLITRASPPRTPLAVRRATPEVPRLRSEPLPRVQSFDLEPESVAPAPRPSAAASTAPASSSAGAIQRDGEPASVVTRLAAFLIDVVVLLAVDAVVIYFTMKICGVEPGDLTLLPKVPLAAFLVVQNGGYLVAFTLGGQTLGKMLLGIRVVPAQPDDRLDLGRSVVRTVVWALLAVPAGLGFVPALFSRDHRGLHDRCAGTRVVRAA